MGDLAIDTRVEGSGGRYRASISRDWEVWGPNGGYLAVVALRAAARETTLERPASCTCHFLRVARFDAVDLTVTTLRATRRAASLRVSMAQDGEPVLEAIAWMVARDGAGLEHDVAKPADVPGPAALRSTEELLPPEERAPYPFWQNLESRPIDWVHWRERQPGAPEWREWYRFRPRATFSDPFVDAARSLLLLDTMVWPACCRAYPSESGPGYVAPSLDVYAHFHRLARDSEWLLAEATAPVATQGLVGGRARVWSATGQLLASGGAQLLCRPAR